MGSEKSAFESVIEVEILDEVHNGFLAVYDDQIIIVDPYIFDNAFKCIDLAVHNSLKLTGTWGEKDEFLVESAEIR